MERMSWPNRITITRILLIAPFVLCLLYLEDERWGEPARYAALVIVLVMAVSDFVDGYLARRFKQETTIGRFLDPCADLLLILSSVILLAHRGTQVKGAELPVVIAVIVVGKELIQIVGFCIVYIETSIARIDVQRVGKWCTATLMLMVLAILASPDLPAALRRLPQVLWWTAAVLSLATVYRYFQMARTFIAEHEARERRQATQSAEQDTQA